MPSLTIRLPERAAAALQDLAQVECRSARDQAAFLILEGLPAASPATAPPFITDGIESALERAREAARDKDVFIGGGGGAINQYLAAELVDELELHVVPILLGGGERLFAGVGPDLRLKELRAVEAPRVTHLKYRVVK